MEPPSLPLEKILALEPACLRMTVPESYRRILGRSAKRLHYLMFMVNETRGALAALFECLNTFVDLERRKTPSFPPHIAATIDAAAAADARLDWPAPICGAMHV